MGNQVILVVDEKARNADRLVAHLKASYPVVLRALPKANISKLFYTHAQPGDIGVFISYPIDEERDIDAVEAFIAHVLSSPGYTYYAPRPNPYFSVRKTSMYGMNPIQVDAQKISRRFQYKNRLAHRLSLVFSKNRLFFKAKPGKLEVKTLSMNNLQTMHPEISLPKDLPLTGLAWQAYEPGSVVLKRDLLERVEDFFPHPGSMHIIVLNRCNLKCVMCPYHSPSYRPHHTSGYFDEMESMTPAVFEKIAEYAGKHKISMQFGQIEETLLHRNLVDFVALAKSKGVPRVHITTNATLLTAEKSDALIEAGLDSIMFSLDAANPETYQEIRGYNLAKTEDNIQYFLKKAKGRKIKTTVSFILQPQAKAERDAFLAKWQAAGIDCVTYYVLTEHDPSTGEALNKDELYVRGENRYPCASPWYQTVVFPDGDISLCCKTMADIGWRGMVSVGSLQEQTFEEIWKGPRYTQVREELMENVFNDFDVCADCTIWSATTYLTEKTERYDRTYNETLENYTFAAAQP